MPTASKSKSFVVGVGLQEECVLSQLFFTVCMSWVGSHSKRNECITDGKCKLLYFANDLTPECTCRLPAACDQAEIEICTKTNTSLSLWKYESVCTLQVNGKTLQQINTWGGIPE